MTLGFFAYQVVYWNVFRDRAVRPVNNHWYADLGARWYDAEDTPNVRLAGTQEAVQRVLDRTGLSRLFTTDATAETAVATLQGA